MKQSQYYERVGDRCFERGRFDEAYRIFSAAATHLPLPLDLNNWRRLIKKEIATLEAMTDSNWHRICVLAELEK